MYPGVDPVYTYDKGVEVRAVDGEGFCGTLDQWLNGALTTDPLPLINPKTGSPFCCGGTRMQSIAGKGGLKGNGRGRFTKEGLSSKGGLKGDGKNVQTFLPVLFSRGGLKGNGHGRSVSGLPKISRAGLKGDGLARRVVGLAVSSRGGLKGDGLARRVVGLPRSTRSGLKADGAAAIHGHVVIGILINSRGGMVADGHRGGAYSKAYHADFDVVD